MHPARAPASLSRGQSALKALGLWLLLICIFAFVYFEMSARPAREAPPLRTLLPTALVPLGGMLLAVVFAVLTSRLKKWNERYSRGIAQLTAGELDAAAATFEESVRHSFHVWRTVSLAALGQVELQRGRLDVARVHLRAAEAGKRLGQKAPVVQSLPAQLAACAALLGDVSEARALLQECTRQGSKGPVPFSLLAEAVLLLREGCAETAAKALTERWAEAEALGGTLLKVHRVLRALALHALDASGNADEVRRLVAGVHPLRPGELGFVGAHWPELRAFLDAQGISSHAAA